MMSKIKFFSELKKNHHIKPSEFKELMQCFTLEKVKGGQDVFGIGDVGNTFYIIVHGTCSVQIRNPKIKDWYGQYQEYKQLLEWKEKIFDPKCEKVKEQHIENYQSSKNRLTHQFDKMIT